MLARVSSFAGDDDEMDSLITKIPFMAIAGDDDVSGGTVSFR
ncbi:hypothetical protein [Actinoplanes sp. G11-F43]